MLVSHKHRFIFVHIYKTAGTSLRTALEPYCEDRWRWRLGRLIERTGLHLIDLPHKHLTAAAVRDLLSPEVYDRYFKFAFVRNPWDWQVSLYHYTLRSTDHKQHAMTKAFRDFDEYIRWRVAEELRLQQAFVTDAAGDLIVDYVGHLETLDDDLDRICERVGIPPISLPHANRSAHKDYRSYYTDETRELVAQAYRPDIERFGYTFDGLRPDAGPVLADAAGVR
jgi:hypothetical protein